MRPKRLPRPKLHISSLLLKAYFCLSLGLSANPLLAAGRYSQMVINLPEKRDFHYDYSPTENALTIEFKGTSQADLAPLEHYDETLVRRVIITDLAGQGSVVKLFLKDHRVRATVLDYEDPYRISIELYDTETQTSGASGAAAEINRPSSGNVARDNRPAPAPSTKKKLPAIAAEEPATSSQVMDQVEEEEATVPASDRADAVLTGSGTTPTKQQPRRLLQPAPEVFTSSEALSKAMQEAPEGVGLAWSSYPIYVYRIQTAVYETPKKSPSETPNLSQALSSNEVLAEFAARQFDFGHENKALVAYQQVLLRNPQIFSTSPLHLWRLAEIHLGQGNLTLADGYFEELDKRFPGHALQPFARMRRQDILAIRISQNATWSEFAELAQKVRQPVPNASNELLAQAAIRSAWWDTKPDSAHAALAADRYSLPIVTPQVRMALSSALPRVDSQKTAFIAASLILSDMTRPDATWSSAASKFTGDYAEKYDNPSTGKIFTAVMTQARGYLQKRVQQLASKGNWTDAVLTFEELPESLAAMRNDPTTAWALAESYRSLGKFDKAVPFYALSAKASRSDLDKFKAVFWLAASTSESIVIARQSRGSAAKVETLKRQLKTADSALYPIWDKLDDSQRSQMFNAMKPSIERAAIEGPAFKSAARITLDAWKKSLTTPSATTAAGSPQDTWQASATPSSSAVVLLTKLAKRFAEFGMDKERRETLQLLKQLKPSDIKDDPASRKLWTEQIVGLADEYRKANENLEAGRLFALAGKESSDWEGRAAALYKGGLLLLASGRKQEALEAFKLASEDTGNLYYSNLAKERLNLINANGGTQ